MHVTSTSLESSRKELQQQTEEVSYLNESLHNFEEYTRKNNLEFHGVPESSHKSTEEVIQMLRSQLPLKFKLSPARSKFHSN